MKAVKGHEMKKIDQEAIQNIGIPSIVLMENAARAFAEVFLKDQDVYKGIITIFCGLGNNGGDGFAIARMLNLKKIPVKVIIVGDPEKIQLEAKVNLNIIQHLSIPITYLKDDKDLELLENIKSSKMLIDAIFGIGCSKPIEGINEKVIQWMNASNIKIYAVDIPSGIHADNGRVMNICIKAFHTITFCLPKIGLFLFPGALMTGNVTVVDIGIPEKVWLDENYSYELIDDTYCKLLPKRTIISHKGTYGKVLVVAGSGKMMGAAVLSASAALKSGCGMVKVFTEKGHEDVFFSHAPEVMVSTYHKDLTLIEQTLLNLENEMEWADVVLLGPGMGNDEVTFEIVKYALEKKNKKLVIDADALNALSKNLDLLGERQEKVIITPHIGEMSRLTGYNAQTILESTVEFASAFSKRYPVITVLKSARTIVADVENIYINLFGNHGMAKAGSGDVLSGIIASLYAQCEISTNASVLGVYVHSKAGDLARDRMGAYSMTATNIIEAISDVMKQTDKE